MTLQEKVASVPRWRHRISLPGGIVTPGVADTAALLKLIDLPEDLTGLSVLDVGCSDGFFSFECEKRGAARVVAVDNYSSVLVDTPSGFQVAREALHSQVEFIEADFSTLDPQRMGQFDVVLFLGVLYHLRHPLLGLEQMAAFCRQQLILETLITSSAQGNWVEFYPSSEVNHDPTNWWAPTIACVAAMLGSCGFCNVRTVSSSSGRGVLHAFSPEYGDDAEGLIADYGPQTVIGICRQFVGRDIGPDEVVSVLKRFSIKDFGSLKQALAESRGKEWHQAGRSS